MIERLGNCGDSVEIKINELVDWANKHETDHEKAVDPAKLLEKIEALEKQGYDPLCSPIPDMRIWDSLDRQRQQEVIEGVKRKWNEGWELVQKFWLLL